MRERPILFTGPMVRAILEGRKTQTWRVVKFTDSGRVAMGGRNWHIADPDAVKACPYGQPGDRLWVRETWAPEQYDQDAPDVDAQMRSTRKPAYAADFLGMPARKWRPSIHMPRLASRLTLAITEVRVERLQDITEEDAQAEGIGRFADGCGWGVDARDCMTNAGEAAGWGTPVEAFRRLWESINGGDSWDANPWVWVVEFRRLP